MAEIAPLRGIVYNRDKIEDMGRVVAPPYDVVSPEQQREYHRSHPNNVLRIDLGERLETDENPYDWHERAAYEFNRWLAEGVLIRHDKPAVYLVETDFTDPTTGERKTRQGFICLLRLEEFGSEAKVRPHERTFSAHKAERLNHLKHVQAHLSQIFSVFSDEKRQSREILRAGRTNAPWVEFNDTLGQGHRMWPIFDRDVIHALNEMMRDKTVYIADGHHRYETSLNYRRMKIESGAPAENMSPLNYTLVYLCAVSDPGLAILPAHRLICGTLEGSREELEGTLARFFDVQTFSFSAVDEKSARQAFLRQLNVEGQKTNVVGLYTKLAETYYLLKKKPNLDNGCLLNEWPDQLRQLDTVVLTSLVFQEVLGMTEKDLDDTSRIAYASRAQEAIDQVNEGRAELAAILNPTRIQQVQDVAESGLVMPRKSTFFYPKVTTGLVFNPINPFESITPA